MRYINFVLLLLFLLNGKLWLRIRLQVEVRDRGLGLLRTRMYTVTNMLLRRHMYR